MTAGQREGAAMDAAKYKDRVAFVRGFLERKFPDAAIGSFTDHKRRNEVFTVEQENLYRRLAVTDRCLGDIPPPQIERRLEDAMAEFEALSDGDGIVVYVDGRIGPDD